MATQEALDAEETEVASGAQSHSRHPSTSTISGPLPTDSMVTVRLSDPPAASTLESFSQVQEYAASLPNDLLEEPQETIPMHADRSPDINENAIVLEEDSQEDMVRDVTISMSSMVEEEQSICTSGTIRSRSDSSGTFSSSGSAQVDWDELEKSEEQAPRDEGSDEVSDL